LQFSKSNW